MDGKLQRKWVVITPGGQAWGRASADLRPQTQKHKWQAVFLITLVSPWYVNVS